MGGLVYGVDGHFSLHNDINFAEPFWKFLVRKSRSRSRAVPQPLSPGIVLQTVAQSEHASCAALNTYDIIFELNRANKAIKNIFM